MFDGVPEDWRVASFASLAEYANGRAFKPEDWGAIGLPIIRIAQITNPLSETNFYDGTVEDRHLIDDGDLIFSWSATLAVMKWTGGRAVLNQHLFKVTPAPGIDREWLRFRLEASIPDLAEEAHGTTMKHIRKGTLSTQATRVPPLDEQRRIAEVLRSVDEALTCSVNLSKELWTMRAITLTEMFQAPRGDPANNSRIGNLPLGWRVAPAEEVCEAIIDCKNRTPPITRNGFAVVRTMNVRRGRFVRDNIAFTDETSFAIWTQRGEPRRGDVLITREAPIGEVCPVPHDEPVCLGQRMMLYRPYEDKIRSKFLLYALQSQGVQDHLRRLGGGSTVGHVRVGDIRALPLPIPDLATQDTIGTVMVAIDDAIDRVADANYQLSNVRASLTNDLLTGRVRVPA